MDRREQTTKAVPSRPTKPSYLSTPSPTLAERTSKSATKTSIAAGIESKFGPGAPAEERTSTEKSEDETKVGSHNNPATKIANITRRHLASASKTRNQAAAQNSHPRTVEGASRSMFEKQIETDNTSNQSILGSNDRQLRQRRQIADTETQNQEAVEDIQARWALILSQTVNEIWGLIKFPLTLLRIFWPVLKWLLMVYIIWLAITYSVASAYSYVATQLAPMCAVPFLGSQLPFCMPPSEPQRINASKVATSQDGLAIVMDHVGQNFDLARDMVNHEFAVRDLRIRVAASNLSRKKELVRELESLTRYTKQTAKGLSRFTAKVGKSIDTVKIFDDYAVKALEGIAEQQQHQTLPVRILSAISPLAAFKSSSLDYTEEKVKTTFITTALKISNKVKTLLDESFELGHNLDQIQETLGQIRELTVDESGGVPQKDVLGALWTRLARPNDYAEYKSHTSLLTEMTEFYKSSNDVMKETIAALNHVEAELSEFREDFATPALILKDDPLEVIVALLRKSAERLEDGKMKLEYVEQGARPQINGKAKANTRTVQVKMG